MDRFPASKLPTSTFQIAMLIQNQAVIEPKLKIKPPSLVTLQSHGIKSFSILICDFSIPAPQLLLYIAKE